MGSEDAKNNQSSPTVTSVGEASVD